MTYTLPPFNFRVVDAATSPGKSKGLVALSKAVKKFAVHVVFVGPGNLPDAVGVTKRL